jgi:hypothetical protein
MKKILLSMCMAVCSVPVISAIINVNPDTYVEAFATASNGDVFMLDAGTYATALDFPDGKTITLQKSATAATTPVLSFSWRFAAATTTGSGLKLIGLEINPNADYYIYPTGNSVVGIIEFKDCSISNIHRCLVRASNDPTTINNLALENTNLKDCGSKGYSLVWLRGKIDNYLIKNCTMTNYQGEGFFLASVVQTGTFKFTLQNNTIYLSGRDGAYSWCTIAATSYDPTSTYTISNNIFYKPSTTSDTRRTILVPANSGSVTCKNNLFVDYPNALIAPVAGWDTTNMWVSSVNYFKDAANGNFSLTANFPYKGTDNNYLGAKNWWPEGGSAVHSLSDPGMKISVQKGTIQLVSAKTMHAAELYTSKGTRIIVENIHSNMATIDTKTLAKGVYILKVNMESNILTRKISITN